MFKYFILIYFSFISSIWAYSDSNLCINAIKHFQKKYSIPNNYLYKIAIVETGKYDKTTGNVQPWPWSLNLSGKTHVFNSKKDMLNFIKKKVSQGVSNIDIGCAQINYRFHRDNFRNLDDMISPYRNIRYAAYYLLKNFESAHNWEKAVSMYHSKNRAAQKRYLRKIRLVDIPDRNRKYLLTQNNKKTKKTKSSSKKNTIKNDNIMVYRSGEIILKKELK